MQAEKELEDVTELAHAMPNGAAVSIIEAPLIIKPTAAEQSWPASGFVRCILSKSREDAIAEVDIKLPPLGTDGKYCKYNFMLQGLKKVSFRI